MISQDTQFREKKLTYTKLIFRLRSRINGNIKKKKLSTNTTLKWEFPISFLWLYGTNFFEMNKFQDVKSK